MFQVGSTYFDVTRFTHQLGLYTLKPFFMEAMVARLRGRFLEGFGRPGVAHTPVFALFTLQHVLNHWLGTLRPGQSHGSNLYNRWVRHRHRRTLALIVGGEEAASWG
jgi:hypothetical protein